MEGFIVVGEVEKEGPDTTVGTQDQTRSPYCGPVELFYFLSVWGGSYEGHSYFLVTTPVWIVH